MACARDENEEVVTLAKRISGSNRTSKAPYTTDAGTFQTTLGIPTVVCGPGHLHIIHKPDEYIELEQIALCEAMLARLADWMREAA